MVQSLSAKEQYFGNEWRRYSPHPLFQEWLPFIASLVGLIGGIVGLAVALMNYEKMKSKS